MTGCDDVRALLVLGGALDAEAHAHFDTCDACRAHAPAARALAAVLAADVAPSPPAAIRVRVLRAAALPLARHARRASLPSWATIGRAVAVAVAPLPLLLALDALVVRSAYRALTVVLPAGVSLYLVASYAVVLALLLAMTYAAVPLLAARQGRAGRAGPIGPGGPEESHA